LPLSQTRGGGERSSIPGSTGEEGGGGAHDPLEPQGGQKRKKRKGQTAPFIITSETKTPDTHPVLQIYDFGKKKGGEKKEFPITVTHKKRDLLLRGLPTGGTSRSVLEKAWEDPVRGEVDIGLKKQ